MSIKDKNNIELRLDLRLTYREYVVLRQCAAGVGIDIREFTENIVRNWAERHIKGLYRGEFEKLSVLDLAHLFGDIEEDGKVKTANSKVETEKAKVKARYSSVIKNKDKDN